MTEKSVKIKLAHPVQLADKMLEEVTMRRMTLGDVLDHQIKDAGDLNGEARLVATLCGLNPEDLKRIDFADYGKLQETLVSFRGASAA